MIIPTAREAQQQARARALDKQEQLCELSRALAVLASASVINKFLALSFLRFMLFRLYSLCSHFSFLLYYAVGEQRA